MRKPSLIVKDILLAAAILCVCFLLCLLIQHMYADNSLVPALFVLGVFLISVITQGYIYGIVAAIVSVLAVNFAFTFPFFAFNFTIPENIISAVILLVVTVVTCSLTTKVKMQELIKAESDKERMRANLLRAVSHDLRTPLTTIYGSNSALLDNYDSFSDEQCKRIIAGIKEDSDWLSRIIENLLSITRLDGANVDLIKTPTVLDELIDSVLVKFAKRYPNRKVIVNLPDELVVIPMDALLIEQVLINILDNAVQHAEGMTRITLNVFTISNKAIFEIRDNGCGIADERLKNIFTGHSSDAVPSDGKKNNAGIGLSVCASIIKARRSAPPSLWQEFVPRSEIPDTAPMTADFPAANLNQTVL